MNRNPNTQVFLVIKSCLNCRKLKNPMGKKRCPACQKLVCQHLRSPGGECWSCVRAATPAPVVIR